MSGTAKRSGGWNRKSVALHVLQGTFRDDRHGARLAAQPVWSPTATELAALASEGRAYVQLLTASYDFSVAESRIVLEAGHSVDRLVEIRQARGTATGADRARLDRAERAWQHRLVTALLSLKVRP